ncbi:MAG: sensor histidine kinase [Planctomycetota bacterium]|jgi:signal transduction histidine kinase
MRLSVQLPIGAVVLIALLVWAIAGEVRDRGDPQADLDRAVAQLQGRFQDWRGRVERAAARMESLAERKKLDRASLFEEADRILREEEVHGVAIIDWEDKARCWAGRSFDVRPELDFYYVRKGYDDVQVLEHPAYRVLAAARPAGGEIAVAFYVFEQTFPRRTDPADGLTGAEGIDRVTLEYGQDTFPPNEEEEQPEPDRAQWIEDFVHASFFVQPESEEASAKIRLRWNILLFGAALVAAWIAWTQLGGRLRKSAALRLTLALALIVGCRVLLMVLGLPALEHFNVDSAVHPLWAGPGDILLSALAMLLCAILGVRYSRLRRARPVGWALALLSTLACLLVPPAYDGLLRLAVARQDAVTLFDPLTVQPGVGAGLVLTGLCLLTAAMFLFVHSAYRWSRSANRLLAALPHVALALALLPWKGPWIAFGCILASASMVRGGGRPERAAAVVFLAALTSFPLLYLAEREQFTRVVARKAQRLVSRGERREVEGLLEDAVAKATDPERGKHFAVAEQIAVGQDPKHFAFQLWAASDWKKEVPCAVQVFGLDGQLLSTFDFDSPPARWFPPPPDSLKEGSFYLLGLRGVEPIHFYTRNFLIATLADQRVVGMARFLVPDRWDVLLANLRPSMFSEPLDFLVRNASPPIVLAELGADGTPLRISRWTPSDLQQLPAELCTRAQNEGYAAARIVFRGKRARMVIAAAPSGTRRAFAALVFPESYLQQGGFAFAKVLLTYSAVCLLYVLGVLIARRGRITFLFRHRIVLFVVLLSVPPVLLLALYDSRAAQQRWEQEIAARFERRLDLAETLLGKEKQPVGNDWCTTFAADHLMDINLYRGQELVATSRPGVWDTGLLARRLAAKPYLELDIKGGQDYTGREYFTRAQGLRAAYRMVWPEWAEEPVVLAAPALDDRRSLERRETESNAVLLAVYLTTAMLTVFVALLLARSLTQPLRQLRDATRRVAMGDFRATLPEKRQDEFGELVQAFNRMTREIREAQDLRVRVEKAAAWREMARQIAHEIKNPLTPIKLTVQNLLASYEEDPKGFEEDFESGAKLILDQINALYRIAGHFSSYSRFPERALAPLDVGDLADEVAALFAASGGAAVESDRAPAAIEIDADHDELRRALINLVTNSRQAGATKVELKTRAEPKHARIEVIDDGHGIDRGDLDRIFEPAFTTKSAGTGLGLPIVKRVVDDHAGEIEIFSEPGEGVRVVIRIPRRG